MEHLLNNPAWNALLLGNSQLANGSHEVKYFDKEVSPFAAFRENTLENFRALYDMVPDNAVRLIVLANKMEIPQPWQVLQYIPGLQMVYDDSIALADVDIELTILTEEHVSQMIALTQLTNPGPFAERTIEFGHYRGVFDGGKLVAMAGQRLYPSPYAEISAVCTHPGHLGRGYAKQLLLYQMHRIKAAANIPFLHVRDDNERAIKVYLSLGFKTRIPVHFYVIKKAI